MKNLLDIWRPERRDPWREFSALQRRMDRFIDEFNQEPFGALPNQLDFVPACDVSETENAYMFTLDVPGMPKEALRVEIAGNTLTISGERKEERKKGGGVQRYERSEGRFERSFTLPEISESSQVRADYTDGVLRIEVPKSEAAKSKTRRIEIGEGQSLSSGKASPRSPEKKNEKAA